MLELSAFTDTFWLALKLFAVALVVASWYVTRKDE